MKKEGIFGTKQSKMKVLIACEFTQEVTKAFRIMGHQAYSCDVLDSEGGHPEWHIKGDAIQTLRSQEWDLVISHPPCTVMSNSGVRWLISKTAKEGFEYNSKLGMYVNMNRYEELEKATKFFNQFVLYGKIGGRIAIENPIQHGYAKELIHADYSQIIHPYQFGHKETKATCLWLFGLPLLKHSNNVYNEMMELSYAERSKIHYASPGPERAKIRSKTYPGIAVAMAEQWGSLTV